MTITNFYYNNVYFFSLISPHAYRANVKNMVHPSKQNKYIVATNHKDWLQKLTQRIVRCF